MRMGRLGSGQQGGTRRRSQRRSVEAHAGARRERAKAHLARVRGRKHAATRRRVEIGRRHGLALTAAATLTGAMLANPVLGWLGGDAKLFAIHVRGSQRLSASQLAAATGLEPGAALPSVDAGAAAARVAGLPWVAEARAARLASGRLLLAVVERVPVALALGGGADDALAVDASGTPFAPVRADEHAALPRLRVLAPLTVGEPDAALARAAGLARRVRALGIAQQVEVELPGADDPEGFALRIPELPGRIVIGLDEFDDRLARLGDLLAAQLPEARAAAVIDLRFADQAVLREEPLPQGAAKAAGARGHAASSESRSSG